MKKLAFLATLLILGLSFTSCEGKKGDDSSDKAAATAPAAPAANDAVASAEAPINLEGKKPLKPIVSYVMERMASWDSTDLRIYPSRPLHWKSASRK